MEVAHLVHMPDCFEELHHVQPDGVLVKRSADLLFVLHDLGDVLLALLHDDVESAFCFIKNDFLDLDDILVVEFAEDFYFDLLVKLLFALVDII